MNEITAITSLFKALPVIAEGLTKAQEIFDDYEVRRELKQAEKDYLKSVLALYKSGKISGDQAMDALKHIFKKRSATIEVKPIDPIEQMFQNLLN
ncbi:hypothetical protein VKI21_06765 [Cyanobacterium aponinum UTEX 3222]|uniref:hypothetical protein n=1 Tax=Cyanobacterium aponinum TaxID=379064 RepID=UPI00309288D2|nr:hypothetical protein VKI21_06765 [Cyanobacterium aponinum UTEX 3222]